MERPRFEAPDRTRWPAVLGLAALVAVAVAAGFWFAGGETPGRPGTGQELLSQATPAAPAARTTPVQAGASPEAGERRSPGAAGPEEASTPSTSTPPERPQLPPQGLTGTPIDDVPVDDLLDTADEAFDIGDWRVALDTYKIAAVRLQVQMQHADDEDERQLLADTLDSVQERVRVAQTQSGIEAGRSYSLENRAPHAPPAPGETRELSITDLGNFPYNDETGGIPADVAALDGLTVRIHGYMVPAFQTDQIRQFTLVPDIYECCFGQPPGVEHTINVVLPEGRAVIFSYGEILVTGTLRVHEERRGGYTMNLFTIEDVTSVRSTGRS